MMRLFAHTGVAFLATAIVMACDQNGTPTSPEHEAGLPSFIRFTQHFDFDETFVEITTLSDCTGEEVTFVGVIHHRLTVVSDDFSLGNLHATDQLTLHATGTGLTTGAQYLVTEHDQFNFDSPSGTAPHLTQTERVTSQIVSLGSADNTFFSFDLHFLVTGQGEFKVTVDNFAIVCKG